MNTNLSLAAPTDPCSLIAIRGHCVAYVPIRAGSLVPFFGSHGCNPLQSFAQFRIGHRVDLTERNGAPRDTAFRVDNEQGSVVDQVSVTTLTERSILLSYGRTRIAGKQEGKLIVLCPGMLCLGGIGADPDENDVAATAEKTGVLITVRMHLNRSATRPHSEEKREHYRFAAIVAELHGVFENAVPCGSGQLEVGSHLTDLEHVRAFFLGNGRRN